MYPNNKNAALKKSLIEDNANIVDAAQRKFGSNRKHKRKAALIKRQRFEEIEQR